MSAQRRRPSKDTDVLAMPPAERFAGAARFFAVIGHRDRIRILLCLGRGDRSIVELARLIGMSPAGVTPHVRMMKLHGLIEHRKDEHRVLYRPTESGRASIAVISANLVRVAR